MEIGKRIRAARKEAGLTQDELAARVGVSRSAIAQWETRPKVLPSHANMDALTEVLRVNYEWLAKGNGPMHRGASEPTGEYNAMPADLRRVMEIVSGWPTERRRALLQVLGEE
ncbi:helix-turn-helix domain-containing protein [Endothiovibrio diazotrophicus]